MVEAFDRIVIAVPDLELAVEAYEQLLGLTSSPAVGVQGAWLGLSNTVIELQQQPVEKARIRGIVFRSEGPEAEDRALENSLQLAISLSDGSATAGIRRQIAVAGSVTGSAIGTDGLRVDHLVLRTSDAPACIDLFRDQLGVRLALDQTVPEWGGRMLFFRAGQLTLEVIESGKGKEAGDYFWGIAYQCQDLEQTASALAQRNVALSEIREGRKPGTRVATVKSHSLGIPTLLVQPAT